MDALGSSRNRFPAARLGAWLARFLRAERSAFDLPSPEASMGPGAPEEKDESKPAPERDGGPRAASEDGERSPKKSRGEQGRPERDDGSEERRQRARLRIPDPRAARRGTPLPVGGPAKPMRTLALWLFILLVAVIGAQMYFTKSSAPIDISYTRFRQEIDKSNIKSLTITQGQVSGELRTESQVPVAGKMVRFTKFKTYILGDGENLPEKVWETNPGVEIVSKPPATNWWAVVGTWVLPLVVIVALWLFIFRQMQSGGSAALKFGKSRAKVQLEASPKVTFRDVAGCEEAKQELQEIIEFLKDPQKFVRLGGRIPKGALLLGPPGTGKTLLAKAVAGEAGVPFFSMSGSDFVEMFVGVGASVTGDTPILIRENGRVRLVEIGEFVDRYFREGQEDVVIRANGIETLGIDAESNACWQPFRGVYRHRVQEIYEIRYADGQVRTTGDHSVFVQTRDGISSIAARDLRPGDLLLLPSSISPGVRRDFEDQCANPSQEGTRSRQHDGLEASPATSMVVIETDTDAVISNWQRALNEQRAALLYEPVLAVSRLPYDGFVYDLCGCGNEAFFGGEKPILLHNSRVRDLFDQGKRHAPCILFIDEIDAVGRHRGAGLGGGHDEREQTLNQLLVEMDGFDSNEGVILIAATNRPDVLDPALLRPGRFDRHIVVDWPDLRGREGILRVHTRKIPLSEDVNLEIIARGTPGMAGADLANLVNEAALLAARRNRKKVAMQDFEDAKDKVMLGMERRSLVLSDEEKRRTAYHESGHALVAWLLPGSDPVHKVTIVPRGRALGLTASLPAEERFVRSKSECERRLVGMLGGRAADKLIFDELTTGAASDIEQATGLARRMVCEWGMSEALGPLTFGKNEEMVFLGREIASHKDYSEETAQLIDKEIRSLVEGAYERALQLLSESRDKLELLAGSLLEREALDGDEMDRLLRGEILPPLPPPAERYAKIESGKDAAEAPASPRIRPIGGEAAAPA